jgi:hypothetical protein
MARRNTILPSAVILPRRAFLAGDEAPARRMENQLRYCGADTTAKHV